MKRHLGAFFLITLSTVAAAQSAVVFTSIPDLGAFDDLAGRVENATPADHRVAVYIFVEGSGWWNKPTFDDAATPIAGDGTWTADITTGSGDETASKIAAFLVAATYTPPRAEGTAALPPTLLSESVAHAAVSRSAGSTTRLIYFSGEEWWVKSSGTPVGPGPNIFSESRDNVWLDDQKRLHLKITKDGENYRCAEIVSDRSFGYGSYVFRLGSAVDILDPNVILGLFTWSDDPDWHYREIDIEFTRWGEAANEDSQFVVQPWDTPGNMERFNIGPDHVPSSHGFTWLPESIVFRSARGTAYLIPESGDVIREWAYTGADIPVPGNEKARMNLWLRLGLAPLDEQEIEVIIDSFDFVASEEGSGEEPPMPLRTAGSLVPALLTAGIGFCRCLVR